MPPTVDRSPGGGEEKGKKKEKRKQRGGWGVWFVVLLQAGPYRPPGLRGHGDRQTVVFFLPKLRPAIFTIKMFCATTLTFTSASPLK
jgi:hypothetical protein